MALVPRSIEGASSASGIGLRSSTYVTMGVVRLLCAAHRVAMHPHIDG
jgi:hypothetical protein